VVRFKCYAGCEPRDVLDVLRRRGLLDGHGGGSVRGENISGKHQSGKCEDEDIARKHTRLAREIWNAARDPRGTPVEEYLCSRGLGLDDDLAGHVLRFHPRCPWQDGFLPALIVVFRSIDDNAGTAIHRIRLDQPERWPKAERKMLGPVGRAAVKLDRDVGDALAICDGLETCMALPLNSLP